VYRHDKLWFGVTPFLAAGGINSQLFFPKEIRERKEGEPFTIMVYGRLTEHIKGTELVVEACERLHGKYPFIRLLLFDTPVNESMSNAIASFQSSIPFEFVLNHPVEQNVALFHKADIFVAAEKQTGWANTVAEAMAAGIPVVATRSGTLDILYNHETGIRVRRNVRSIMHGIESLLLSLELRRMLAENARRHIVKFDWQILADRILDWYHEKEKA
jgi:glycosyltransferase involved in cell wall biosynthesis